MSQVVIVTGGGSEGGIGNAIVHQLVAADYSVAIMDIDLAGAQRTTEQVEGMSGSARAFRCDVSDRGAVFSTVRTIESELGPAWGLVNTPAWAAQGPAEELDEDSWRRGLDVTLSGTLWCCQAVFPQMRQHGGGRIVTFGSEVSERPTHGPGITYLSAKGAIRSLTRGLAWEWGRHGITVNMLWPLAATAGYKRFAENRTDDTQAQIQQNALGRLGDARQDIAPIVEFLLSPQSSFITGATIPANGGRVMP